MVDANSPNMKTNKLVRLLRLLRLLKLLRIERLAKLKRIVSQYEQNHFGLMALFQIMRPVGVVAWIGHWMACAWFFFGTSEGQAKDEQGNLLKGWVARNFGGDSTIDDQTQCKPTVILNSGFQSDTLFALQMAWLSTGA